VTAPRSRLPLAVAAALAIVALTFAGSVGSARADQAKPRASVQQMYNLLMCTGCHESLAVAESPQSYAERAQVRRYVLQGKTPKQIENLMVQQYGPAVLAKPPKHGFSLLVYIVPPVVVVGGIALLLYTVPRWRRRTAQRRAEAPELDESELTEEETDRVDRELERL
jgi:cytochrome c-type biogenesis protein CcmH